MDHLQRCVAKNVANHNYKMETQGIDCGLGQQELWNGTPVMTTTTTMMMIPEPQHGINVNE